MKQTERYRQFGSIHHLTVRGGFTLVEVLVVMAIMVILFGMLFVPISSSIDMARAGQARTQMQQQLQMAMQRINRGLATARGIYLPEYIPVSDGTYLINYSNITFQPGGPGGPEAVRYAVMTQEYDIVPISGKWYCIPQPPDIDNPWILYRMEGMMEPVGGRNLFGAVADIDTDSDGNPDIFNQFVIGFWSSRNALTPARGADIPVTRTICLDAGPSPSLVPLKQPYDDGEDRWARGYVDRGDLDDNGTNDIEDVFGGTGVMLVYIHDGVKFGPLRVENERLADAGSGDTTTFSAEYGHWLGLPNPVAAGTYSIGEVTWDPMVVWPDFPMLIYSSELRPRIVVRREIAADDYQVIMDTDELPGGYASQPAPSLDGSTVINNMFGISWNSAQGTVSVASAAGPAYAVIGDFSSPLPGYHAIWPFIISSTPDVSPVDGSDEYVEPITAATTLAAGAFASPIQVPNGEAAQFSVGDEIRLTQQADTSVTETITITSIDSSTDPDQISFAPATLANSYSVGDWVQTTGTTGAHYRKAYSQYLLAPPLDAAIADKKVVPDSVRVRVNATGTSGTASKEYRQVLFADPSAPTDPELANLGYGQFAIQSAPGHDYRAITIHFGNGEDGGNGVRTPPPSPDEPSTFGGTTIGWDVDLGQLDGFWIEISYKVRRNFSTATLANDQIDVSYSTRAVYNVSLELRPWRYYEDNDVDHIWTPYQHAKGVDLQAHIPIAALGG